jgi:hypothetical protein
MGNRKTAVEWLVDQILSEVEMHDEFGEVNKTELWNAFISCTDLSEYVNKAKQMEKEQIIEAWQKTPQGFNHTGEQYYSQTYNNEQTI